ncbi:hypothetical protein C922_03138 [Plasmodium inui San Antonio 1]|uniref:Uncharacterized protein n=1 Tax=Plasmodium inui San Antonio 1 TaxID=1237626 RepID=W7ABS5_9APIC|nr:hypothetical protein C922_03138 [Plasmodium inui San Antonio 1]EUD66504.1 hypothetical protein C922_03138 [Plasmodium inui San Antonio 1]
MKIYIFAYVFILSIFASRGVKLENSHYIRTQLLKRAHAKKTAKKKVLKLNPRREENYLETIQSNIAKAARGVNSPGGLIIMTLALGSLVGFFYKHRQETTGEGSHGSSGSSGSSGSTRSTPSSGLFKYKCVKCNLVIFPSKGRDQKFVKEVGKGEVGKGGRQRG